MVIRGRTTLNRFRIVYDVIMIILFQVSVTFKIYGYSYSFEKGFVDAITLAQNARSTSAKHPINVGANLYGVAACMAFLKVIFFFEVHYRFGPILFCIRSVIWDVLSVLGSYLIVALAFGIGLVAVFGVFEDSATHFKDLQSAFKTLFWILFDPGKEEYADILPPEGEGEECCCSGSGRSNITLTRVTRQAVRGLNNTLRRQGMLSNSINLVVKAFKEDSKTAEESRQNLSHGFGIYLWGIYQARQIQ